jgi:hypothetical protein
MNVTPISGTNNVTPVQPNQDNELVINYPTPTNVPNKTQWLSQEAFMLDVINAFQNFGFNILDNLGVNNTNNTNSLLSNNMSLSEALNNFVYSLQAALNQASQTGAPNQEEPTGQENPNNQGFNNFATDLLLLSLLNNNNSSLINDNNINSNPLLQSNFNTLLSVLSTLSPTVTAPTLNDFFNRMLNNLEKQINSLNNVGTSISTTA